MEYEVKKLISEGKIAIDNVHLSEYVNWSEKKEILAELQAYIITYMSIMKELESIPSVE
jgi:hypothetical protein